MAKSSGRSSGPSRSSKSPRGSKSRGKSRSAPAHGKNHGKSHHGKSTAKHIPKAKPAKPMTAASKAGNQLQRQPVMVTRGGKTFMQNRLINPATYRAK